MTEDRDESAARLAEEAKLVFRTYKDWREQYPLAHFWLHNTLDSIEDGFGLSVIDRTVTEMKPSIIDEVSGEIWFDTIRFNLDSLSKREIVSFIGNLYADKLTLQDDE